MSTQYTDMQMKWRVAGLVAGGLALLIALGIFLAGQWPKQPPPDFAAIDSVAERKQAFFDYLRPSIEAINAERAEERSRLQSIADELASGQPPGFFDRRRLREWAERYELEYDPDNLSDLVDELLIRLDQIPASMVLAQAAMESAWGTSRFAVDGNNYFGQWCYREGCGLVPARRNEGASHEVRLFASAEESVRAYFRNINSHGAYQRLREMRASMREASGSLSGMRMVEGLQRYSQRGQAYVDELQSVIRGNDLE